MLIIRQGSDDGQAPGTGYFVPELDDDLEVFPVHVPQRNHLAGATFPNVLRLPLAGLLQQVRDFGAAFVMDAQIGVAVACGRVHFAIEHRRQEILPRGGPAIDVLAETELRLGGRTGPGNQHTQDENEFHGSFHDFTSSETWECWLSKVCRYLR